MAPADAIGCTSNSERFAPGVNLIGEPPDSTWPGHIIARDHSSPTINAWHRWTACRHGQTTWDLRLEWAIRSSSADHRCARHHIGRAPALAAAFGSSAAWKCRVVARARLASSLRGLRAFRRSFHLRIARTGAASDQRQPQVSRPILFGLDGLVSLEKPHQRCPLSKAHRHASFVSYPTFVDEILPGAVTPVVA